MIFRNEAANIEKFRRNNEGVKFLSVPRVFSEFTREDVLVIEHVEGIKITDLDSLQAEDYDLKDIGIKLAANYFKQVFEHGFFHADPHPGNLLIRDRKIVYIDFGMMGTIDDKLRQSLNLFFAGVVEGDISAMTRAAVRIGVPMGEVNRDNLRTHIERIYYDYADLPMSDIDRPALANQVFKVWVKPSSFWHFVNKEFHEKSPGDPVPGDYATSAESIWPQSSLLARSYLRSCPMTRHNYKAVGTAGRQ